MSNAGVSWLFRALGAVARHGPGYLPEAWSSVPGEQVGDAFTDRVALLAGGTGEGSRPDLAAFFLRYLQLQVSLAYRASQDLH